MLDFWDVARNHHLIGRSLFRHHPVGDRVPCRPAAKSLDDKTPKDTHGHRPFPAVNAIGETTDKTTQIQQSFPLREFVLNQTQYK